MAKPDTIIRGLWEFLQTCPYIEAGSPVTVDCMPMDNNAFTLAKRSGNPIVKMYTDGSSIRQYPFAVWYRGNRGTIQEDALVRRQAGVQRLQPGHHPGRHRRERKM